jgi:endonuclease YncB( thermonuclease family)
MTRALLLSLALLVAAEDVPAATDGDSIRLGAESIRIVGLDTPELGRPGCMSEYHAALRARDRLAELLAGGVVIHRRGRDLYGRTLAVVRDLAGRDLAEVLIAEGLARPYTGRTRRSPWCDE